MVETVPERHYRDRVQSVQRLASLTEPERLAMSWQDHEDLVGLCLDISVSGRALIEKEYGRIFTNASPTVGWLSERRRVIEDLSDSYVQLARAVRTSVSQARQGAGSSNGEDLVRVLEGAIQSVEAATRSVLERWPVGSPEERAEAKAAIVRGETLDADEAFAEIAGTDVETWRKNIDEYKRRGQHSSAE
jgi:hypothetical protein